MEKNIDDFLTDIAEAKKSDKMDTPGFKLSKQEIADLVPRLTQIVDLEDKTSDLKSFRERF